jgi:hypothetical protein
MTNPRTVASALAATAVVLAVVAHVFKRRRRVDKLTRASLVLPEDSPLDQMLSSGDDGGFICCFGLNVHAFQVLLNSFTPIYESLAINTKTYEVHARSRPRVGKVTAKRGLALTLCWFRTKGEQHFLSLISGLTPSMTAVTIHLGIHALRACLHQLPQAKIAFPSPQEIELYSYIMNTQYPQLNGCFAVLDGLKIQVQWTGNTSQQEAYYNCWASMHCINNVFLFAPSGCIIASVTNAPGSWHISYVARVGGIYSAIAEFVPPRYFAIADSAFSAPALDGRLRTTDKHDPVILSIRQTAEWGMRGFQSAFPRFTAQQLWHQPQFRKLSLECACMLFNFRTNLVGLNQIRTVWMQHLDSPPFAEFNDQ